MNTEEFLKTLFKPQKKTFVKITSIKVEKGLETFIDQKAIESFDDVKKSQIFSIFKSGLEMLMKCPIHILTDEQLEGFAHGIKQKQNNSSIKENVAMEKDLQQSMPKMSKKANNCRK